MIECPFDDYFERQVQELETKDAGLSSRPAEPAETFAKATPVEDDQAGLMAPPPMPLLRRSTWGAVR